MPPDPGSELVTVLDDDGQPCGVATRATVRRENLLHAATAVLVRRSDGRVYVHRRTKTKDIYPGAYDCWAGGVLASDEDPEDGARRELAEELGIEGTTLQALGITRFEAEAVRCLNYVYSVVWDGPVVHQPEEVAWGDWWTLDELAAQLSDPSFVFVPDGRYLLAEWGLLPAGG